MRAGDASSRAPEGWKGELSEIRLELIAHFHGLGVDVEDLAAIGRIERTRSDRKVRRGMHVVPPEELGAGEVGDFLAQLFPQLLAVDQVVALLPKANLGALAVIPAVGHDPVLLRPSAGQNGGLRGAGHRRKGRLIALAAQLLAKSGQTRRVLSK